jgi:hypothetical protein
MITMFVRGTVPDVDTWKQVVDGFGPTYEAFGVVRSAYYRSVDNPNEITAAHEFESIEAARKYAESDELREGRARAGVSAPTVWFAAKF